MDIGGNFTIKEDENRKRKLSRRVFGKRTLSAALVSAVPVSAAFARTANSQEEAESADLTPAQIQEVDARFKEVIRRYGERLSADQQQRVRRILLQNERLLGPIREFAITNGDPPATTLKLVMAEGAGRLSTPGNRKEPLDKDAH